MLRSDSTKYKNVCLTNLNFKQKKTSKLKLKITPVTNIISRLFSFFLTGAVKSNVHLLLHRLRNILNPRKIWFKKQNKTISGTPHFVERKDALLQGVWLTRISILHWFMLLLSGLFVCFKYILWRSHKNMKDRRGVSTVVIIINNNNLNKRKISGIWR